MEQRHIESDQEREQNTAAKLKQDGPTLGQAQSGVLIETESVPAAEPELEVRIERHKLSDRTPEEAFASQRTFGKFFHPVDDAELAETLTLGPEKGEIGKYAAEHKGAFVFRWAWVCDDMLEEDFSTLERAREDLILRLHMNIEANEEDRRTMERLQRARQNTGGTGK